MPGGAAGCDSTGYNTLAKHTKGKLHAQYSRWQLPLDIMRYKYISRFGAISFFTAFLAHYLVFAWQSTRSLHAPLMRCAPATSLSGNAS